MRVSWKALVLVLLAPHWLLADDPSTLPKAMGTCPKSKPVAPPSAQELESSIRRGIDFLLARQNGNGSWGSAHNTTGMDIYAPVPGAHDAFCAG